MNKILLSCLAVLAAFTAFSQNNFFSDVKESDINTSNSRRVVFPTKYRTTSLDNESIRNFLRALPQEASVVRALAPVISLPMPDGSLQKFRVWESSIQEPGLQAQFPDIRTYAGQGIDDPYATIRFDYNPYDGFHAQILSPTGRIYLDPYARNDINHYITYFHRDNLRNPFFLCDVASPADINLRDQSINISSAAGACRGTQLYTYRLAVACTGEYAVAVGGTTAALLHSKIVTSVNRVNGVYEQEVAVRLVLVASNNLVEFLDAATDPFTGNSNANTLITESQTQITNRIGSANFDIGHTFSTGAGGLAGLGVVCNTTNKARGVTGSSNPVGDGYDIDYVAHEMGHQFSGNHTFNGALGSCSGANRNGTTAYEPGSGTTIQAYAGICGTDNTQPNSDPYFHTVSFDEISNFIEAGGATCRVVTATGNSVPVISAMNNNGANIPINTPFTLTGAASDPDGDAITYCWEEWDLGAQGNWNTGATSTTAPLFKSRIPKTTGSRTFPDMAVILAGYPANPATTMGGLRGETLPTVARAMKFRLTVRDNRSGGGGVATGGNGCQAGFTGTFQVNTITGTGPFAITSPNGGESYSGNSSQTITWNTAGSNGATINCQFVKISLSTDGGNTYPTVITETTSNDGTEVVTMPNITTTSARIKVEAVGNIFFDISNANFSLTASASSTFNFDVPAATNINCNSASTASVSLGTTSVGGYTTPINLSASGNPAGTTVNFSNNPVTPGNATTVTLNNVNTLSAGTYTLTITGISGSITNTRVLTFTVLAGSSPSITSQPANQSVCAGTNANFSVSISGSANAYQWQLSTDGGTVFNNISGATNASYTVSTTTTSQNNYRYKVNITGQCNSPVSNVAILTVNDAPSVPSITPTSVTMCNNAIQTLSATAQSNNTFQFGTQAATNTASTTNAGYPAPYTIYYGGQRMQMLIRASELTNAGFSAGSQINNIQFPVVSKGTSVNSLSSFQVKIGASDSVTIATFQTGLQQVIAPASFTPAVGYNNTHTFSTPYTWNGTSNIVIETTFSNNITGGTNDLVTQYNSPAGFQSTVVYRADGVTASTAAAATTVNFIYSSRPDFKLNGVKLSNITWSPIQNLYFNSNGTNSYNGNAAPVVYLKPTVTGNSNITVTASNGTCSTQTILPVTVNNCQLSLNLKVFLEGYYTGSSTMQSTLYNLGMNSNPLATDTIDVDLWSAANLANATPNFSYTTILQKNGTCTLSLTGVTEGASYYIAIRHRNHLELWSAAPVTFTASTTYDFSNALSKAYTFGPAAMRNLGAGVFGMYAGDINQDGVVESTDYTLMENAVQAILFGYYNTDITGDGVVESSDYTLMENNVQSILFYMRPNQQRIYRKTGFKFFRR